MPPRKSAPAKKAPAKKATQQLVKPDPEIKKAVRRKRAAPVPPPVSLTQVRIRNRTYPLVRDPGCPICTHPLRVEIEERILLGDHYTSIARDLSGRLYEHIDGDTTPLPELRPEQISRHYAADHSPLDARVLRDIRAEVAGVQAEDYEQAGKRLVDGLGFAKYIISEVQTSVVRGDQTPTIKEGIAAARIEVAAKMAAAGDDGEQAADQSWFYEQALDVYMAKAREIMNAEQWEAFMESLYQDQTLQSLIQKRNGAVEAVVIEERTA